MYRKKPKFCPEFEVRYFCFCETLGYKKFAKQKKIPKKVTIKY
jgi:hypothetical protein